MASTSPAGASSNVRRSLDTIPQPPATATVGSSSAADERRHDVAGRLEARVQQDDDRAAGPPQADVRRRAVAQPRRRPDDLERRRPRAMASSAARLGVRRPIGDDHDRRAVRRVGPEPGERPRQVVRPVRGDQHDRGDARSTVRRAATARSRSSRSGPAARPPRPAARPARARSRCPGRRPSSRPPRSRRAAGRPRPSPGPRGRPPGRARRPGRAAGCAGGSSGRDCAAGRRGPAAAASGAPGPPGPSPRAARARAGCDPGTTAPDAAARPAARARRRRLRRVRVDGAAPGRQVGGRPGRVGIEGGQRQERVGDRRVGPVEDDRAHLAHDDLGRRQVAVIQAVRARPTRRGRGTRRPASSAWPPSATSPARTARHRGRPGAARDPRAGPGSPPRASTAGPTRRRRPRAGRVPPQGRAGSRPAGPGSPSRRPGRRHRSSIGPSTCAVRSRPAAGSAAISGGTRPGSRSASRPVTRDLVGEGRRDLLRPDRARGRSRRGAGRSAPTTAPAGSAPCGGVPASAEALLDPCGPSRRASRARTTAGACHRTASERSGLDGRQQRPGRSTTGPGRLARLDRSVQRPAVGRPSVRTAS